MKQEIERKFRVVGDRWRELASAGMACRQGYFFSGGQNAATVRARVMGRRGFLTLKGPSKGISRAEFEYEIPVEDAEYLLDNFCASRVISKTRYRVQQGSLCWEIDEFAGENRGLVLAEIELTSENQLFEKPDWLGEEVSEDPRYFNISLAEHPWSEWRD